MLPFINSHGGKKTFISLEVDIKIAQAAAEAFAKDRCILYHDNLCRIEPPLITAYKHHGKWFLAEIGEENIRLITNGPFLNQSGTKEEALRVGEFFAKEGTFVPSIGITLSDNPDLTP